ncbi:MAG: aldose 1-epimerase family protein [Clostridia bacterium]|nr:aldose 1-epimerase family protein [Clostridia bacterium]
MTFTLKSAESTAVVNTHGGELTSFIHGGIEYVWQGDPAHWNGQAPILFPVCCSPKDGVMAHNGVSYPMPKHGFARKGEFFPTFVSKDRVILEQRETDETLAMFPFCFALCVEYAVTDSGFSAKFTVKNRDRSEMTFCLGGHPGFNCPLTEEDGGFEDYSLVFDDASGCTVSITNAGFMDASVPKVDHLRGTNEIPLKYSDFDNDAMIIENLPKKKVRLVSRLTGKGLNFTFDGFDALGLWTPDHKESPFICLEPWNGLPADVSETTDAKNKKYARTIQPDEEYTVGYEVEVIR